jgi:hypothetical protein
MSEGEKKSKRTNYGISDEQFVSTYQGIARQEGTTLDVAKALNVPAKYVSIRAAALRKHGVELLKLKKGARKDWGALAELAKQS